MRKRMILTALAAVAIPTLLMAADEARLMRFPAMVQRLYSRMLAIYIRSRLQVVRHSD